MKTGTRRTGKSALSIRRRVRTRTAGVLAVVGALLALACAPETESDGVRTPLLLDPSFENPNDPDDRARPATDYTLFEADPVRPVAVLERSGLVAVTNTVNDTLELLRSTPRGVFACGVVKVGLRPVAVASVRETRRTATLWVVNHVSDSISIVEVDVPSCRGEVVDTLHVGDEPRDIVVTRTSWGAPRVFVTTAHRGQHHPVASARLGHDLVTPPDEKTERGLADVFVFDPRAPRPALRVVNSFTDTPRALAVGPGVVYVAGFHTGNRTTAVPAERVALRGVQALGPLLARDAAGNPIEQDGELVLAEGVRGNARIEGGLPAVSGKGRCMPDPRPDRFELDTLQLCVATDDAHRVTKVFVETPGVVRPECQCTSGDGTLQPTTALIVRFFEREEDCGDAFHAFPDGTRGCWLDAVPGGVATPAARSAAQPSPMEWNDEVRLSLPDEDVFAIDVNALEVTRAFSGVGTILFGMAVRPGSDQLFVLNTEAQNLTRFEGHGNGSSTTVIGHLHESRVTVLDTRRGRVRPVHLNTHVDYGRCCERDAEENARSLAFPTAGVFSEDGKSLYFTALGSDKVVRVNADALLGRFDNVRARRQGALEEIYAGEDVLRPSGPVGLALDSRSERLYVKTHFTNELLVLDADGGGVIDRVRFHSPEPPSIRRGRHVLYNARLTSSHGDSACASCHVFGNFDSISWDLGDPDLPTVENPGPYAVAPENAQVGRLIAGEPTLTPDFRSNKGPMATQTLRGLANHGALHWRGDRTRRFRDAPGMQPDFGSLNEDNSFGEFDVAIVGLNGSDELLDPDTFQAFTNFALQLTLPPNPVRALDDSLRPDEAAGRALFFGCLSQTDEQFESGTCVALDGSVVEIDTETERCSCYSNVLVRALRLSPSLVEFATVLRGLLADPTLWAALSALVSTTDGLPPPALAQHDAARSAFVGGREGLLADQVTLVPPGMVPAETAGVLVRLSSGLLGLVGLSAAFGTPTGSQIVALLLGAAPPEARAPRMPFAAPESLLQAFELTIALSNLTLRTWADEAARGTGDFRNLRQDCALSGETSCRLRVSDTLETCHGCHRLDPKGNAEFDVFRPGFFGTSGEYSFENESQVLKVPHLRNAYAKAGMFGTPTHPFFVPESVHGPRRGGLFAAESRYTGPQVRGFGFLHDGSTDTLHRFHGAQVFAARPTPPGPPGIDPGNPGAMDAFFPSEATRAACVARFRAADPAGLPTDVFGAEFLPLCLESSGLPESCFLDPSDQACQMALAALALELGNPELPTVFVEQILPMCYQLGSTLEGGAPSGDCFPEGLRERAELEAFVLAFDSNLKPMVGQQLTLTGYGDDRAFLRKMVASAARGHCDIAAIQRGRGYVMTRPNPTFPEWSRLEGRGRESLSLQALAPRTRGPVTLTCHPPQKNLAEARRAARDAR